MENKEFLEGGRKESIYRQDDVVVRPANEWTVYVHEFLRFVRAHGVEFVPIPYGIDEEGNERLSFMEGDVFNYPLPEMFMTDEMIRSAAELLRRFHEISEQYVAKLTGEERWMLEVKTPVEVLCHGDFAPYNVTVMDGKAVNMIDFDTIHPGSRMWDIVYGAYRWVPFSGEDESIEIDEKIRRGKVFLDAYGVGSDEREVFVDLMIRRLEALMQYMKDQAESGNADFQANIEDGHLKVYLEDVECLKKNRKRILQGIR